MSKNISLFLPSNSTFSLSFSVCHYVDSQWAQSMCAAAAPHPCPHPGQPQADHDENKWPCKMPNKSVAITRRTAVESENEANRPTQGCVPPRKEKGGGGGPRAKIVGANEQM